MQTAGPYRLQQRLSTCEVGDVWSGTDDQDRSVTVAVLNERASVDDRWRGAFAAAADALAQAGADPLPILGSDHDTARPWVACAVERGTGAAQIFVALGQRMQPVAPAPADPPADDSTPTQLVPIQRGASRETQPAPQQGDTPEFAEPASALNGANATRPGATPWDIPRETAAPSTPEADGTQLLPAISAQPVSSAPTTEQPPATEQPGFPPAQGYPPAQGNPPVQGYPAQPFAGPFAPAPPARTGPDQGYPAPGYSDQPTSGHPTSGHPTSAQPTSGYPVSGQPTSGYPTSGQPGSYDAYGLGGDSSYPSSGPPQRSRIFGDQPPKKPRRTGLLVTLVALGGLVIGAAAGVGVMSLRGDDPQTPDKAAALTPAQLLLPTAPPSAPGVEPPVGGGWPGSWPTFTSTEATKPMNGLAGVGFDFRIPPTWSCTAAEQASAAVHYKCGTGQGDDLSGGDLVVRTCEQTCDETKRTQLREKEEAWGLHWTKSGPFVDWAETVKINGKEVYGLVYVAFWRSQAEGPIDRELVLHMTTPLATSDDLKKVANSIRDSTFTL